MVKLFLIVINTTISVIQMFYFTKSLADYSLTINLSLFSTKIMIENKELQVLIKIMKTPRNTTKFFFNMTYSIY